MLPYCMGIKMRYYGSLLSLADVDPNNSYGWKLNFRRGGVSSFLISIFGAPHLGARIRHRILTKILKNPKNNESVLDAGCGFGLESLYLGEKGYNVLGVDKMKAKIKIAKKLKKELKNKKVNFRVGDIYKLKPSNKFDNSILFETLEHVDQPKRMIHVISNLLKNDGRLVISFPAKHNINYLSKIYLGHKVDGYEPSDVQKMIKNSGLKVQKIYSIGNSFFSKLFFYIDYLLLRFVPLISAAFFFVSYPIAVFDMENFRSNNPMGYVMVLKKY